MKTICFLVCVASLLGHVVLGQEQQLVKAGIETAGVAGLTVYQTALARPDLAVAKSLINERLLKGEVGEAIRDQTIGRYLHQNGQWQNVSPRLGRQGIDHISMRFDENGDPNGLLVEETKYGSSKLGETDDGIQLGIRWTNKRLQAIGNRYVEVAENIRSGQIQIAKRPQGLMSRQSFPVPLGSDKEAWVWRLNSKSETFIDCPTEYLQKIPGKLDSMANYVKANADGQLSYKKLLNQVKIEGDDLKITIRDATAVDAAGGNLNELPVKVKLDIPLNRAAWASDTIQAKMVEEIRSQMPYLDADEARRLAKGIQFTAKTAEDALAQSSFKSFTTIEAAKAGTAGVLIVVPVEIAFQLINGGQVDWQRVAGVGVLAGGSAVIGSTLGNATTFALIRTEAGYSASSAVAELVGLRSASHFANGAGGLVGGGATAILFAYGGYWLGYYDLQTANRSAVAGVAGVGAGTAASAATLGLIAAYGTASTGTAISTLGGGAAFKASMAWLGGGSLASGGWGMAGGWVVLGGGVTIVALGVTAAVMYGFHASYEHEDNIRLSKTIEYLSSKPTFFILNAQNYGGSR